MRRTTYVLAGVIFLVLTLSAVVVASMVPAHHGGTPARSAAPAAPVAVAPTAADTTAADTSVQVADVMAAYTTPVPPKTLLASLKPSDRYLMFWYDPNQTTLGELGPTTWGGPTSRPVVSAQGNWLQIRLDSRPNGTTGWVRKSDVVLTVTSYRIVVSVSQRSLTLYQDGFSVYSAPVGVGRPQWPTPLGPSFVDAVYQVAPNQQYIYGPVALITGSHSNVFTEFDGGDGTVAIHAYPSNPASTNGVMSSHGCIRASPQTMSRIAQVPAGTPIDFVA